MRILSGMDRPKLPVAVVFVFLLLVACAQPAAYKSTVVRKPEKPITSVQLVYQGAELRSMRDRSPDRPEQYGIYDAPEVLRKRARLVFAANGVNLNKVTTELIKDNEKKVYIDNYGGLSDYVITMRVSGGTYAPRSQVYRLNHQVSLTQGSSTDALWVWNIEALLGNASLSAADKKFDSAEADRLLTELLRQLAADQLIATPEGGIKSPISGNR